MLRHAPYSSHTAGTAECQPLHHRSAPHGLKWFVVLLLHIVSVLYTLKIELLGTQLQQCWLVFPHSRGPFSNAAVPRA